MNKKFNEIKYNVSVVIPTLGGRQLIDTVLSLNKSSIIPVEIIICIPLKNKVTSLLKTHQNIKIIETKKKGQVYQRYIGFLKAKCNYVMQLDDDEILDQNCIEYLLETFTNKQQDNFAVGPLVLDYNSKLSVYPLYRNNIFNLCLYFLLNGFKGYLEGEVTYAGTGIGVNSNSVVTNYVKEVKWLPGGCVLHKKKHLIDKNYFPFEGKAYNEDLIHSCLLSQKGVKLYINKKAKAYIYNENPMENISVMSYVSELKKDFISRNYYLSLIGKNNKIPMYIYYFLIILKFIFLKIFKSGS